MSSVFEELFAINSAIGAIGAIAGSGIHQRQMSIRAKKTPVEFEGVYLGPPEGQSSISFPLSLPYSFSSS